MYTKTPGRTIPSWKATLRRWLLAAPAALVVLGSADAPTAAMEEAPLREVYARVDPAVVDIRTTETDLSAQGMTRPAVFEEIGAGVMVSREGVILTAAHIVETADQIEVRLQSGETIVAHVVTSEPSVDLALIQLERPPRTPFIAPLGDSDAMAVGDRVFIVGAPFGMSHTLTVGYISGRRRPNRTVRGMAQVDFFQTDAAINPGNSGGPMFNMRGEVIGIVSYILSRSGGSDGLGFAVTSRVARLLLERRAFWTGIDGFLLEGELAEVFNVPAPGAGLLVQRVGRGSPAERLGLKAGTIRIRIGEEDLIVGGDIVLRVLDIPFTEQDSLAKVRERIFRLNPGDPVTVTVLRRGRQVTLTSTVPAPEREP